MKICFKCNRKLELNEFYAHSQMADGHLNKCKECSKKDAINTRNKNIHYYREYDRKRGSLSHRVEKVKKYSKTEYGKLAHFKANKKYRESNNLKYQCWIKYNNAINSGKLIRKSCEVCGNKKTHGHHENYFEPLKVRWLCQKHHSVEHNKNKKSIQFY